MLGRVLLILAVFVVGYWALGAFAFLRLRGLPARLRWVLAAAMALWAGGVLIGPH